MKEIRYWEAEDGERFENKDNCAAYERDCLWGSLLNTVQCYTSDYRRITKEDAKMYCCDVAYIIIPSADQSDNFDDAYKQLNKEFFYGELPCLGSENQDLIYRDYDNNWHIWSEEMASLREMAEKFQLFEGE